MISSCMTKLKFLLEPYMKFRLEKTSIHICCLFCIEFSQALLMPYERFVMLLKSRSRTHHPHVHYSQIGDRHKNMLSIQIHQKNVLLLHWKKTSKICFIGFHDINAPSSCCYLSKVLLQKRGMGYAKVIHKKRKKQLRKNGYKSVRAI